MTTTVQLCEQDGGGASPPGVGPLVRLWGLDPSDLPPTVTPHKELAPFLTAVFQEAVPFIEDVPAASSSGGSSWRPDGIEKFPSSKACVNLFKRVVPAKDLKLLVKSRADIKGVKASRVRAETWNLRRSVHENAEIPGAAGWDEWYRCFKENHAQAEKDFSPTVLSFRRMKSWKCKDLKIVQGDHTWTNITMRWEESVHKLPFPLKNRVFPVLQITASDQNHVDGAEFVVVQIALRDEDAPGRNDAVLGAYTSVERLRRIANGVEWIMGTVCDAGGVVPRVVQRLALAGQIARDVDMFLSWIAEERKKPVARDEADSEHAQEEAQGEAQGGAHIEASSRHDTEETREETQTREQIQEKEQKEQTREQNQEQTQEQTAQPSGQASQQQNQQE
ncbi:hypothetical protein E4U43_006366 [Claviceps pusilla]|uniref:DUF3074 domain-containing protein n=1 Tax=Claviceps pusilla TaxID=123648 RepID=A0A9P7SUZ0_9HYPO|nr:hypothetical protein E4U43_006366 [Claviceps pusilla]